MATTKTKKKVIVEEPVEDVEDLELEDLDEDEDDDEVDEAPAKTRKKKAAADEVTFGARQLAAYLSKQTGKPYDARALRVLLRKMAKDGRIARTAEDARSRYSWTGTDDPEVKKILKAVKGGEIEKGRQEALAKLKADNAVKRAAKKAALEAAEAKGKKKKKAAPAPVEDEDDEDLELEDEDDE